MDEFHYAPVFKQGADETRYRLLTKDFVRSSPEGQRQLITIDPQGLAYLAYQAFTQVSYYYPQKHLAQIAQILTDPKATPNDRFTAQSLIKNAIIAKDKKFPLCQDTGTAVIVGHRGINIYVGEDDAKPLAYGVYKAWQDNAFRFSQNMPQNMYDETNTGTNLPCQIEVFGGGPADEYSFIFMAKGGGSSNKTQLFQETKAILSPQKLVPFLAQKMQSLGTSACPPYNITFVIGGLSPEMNLKVVKLGSAGFFDTLPTKANQGCYAIRDIETEEILMQEAEKIGLGAQFGGKYFALNVRVFRLPRHGASLPIGMGVSCNAHRNIKAKINQNGIFLEVMEENPEQYLPKTPDNNLASVTAIDLNRPMHAICNDLAQHKVGAAVKLTGTMIVARDMAHARFSELLAKGQDLPQYLKDHPVLYAGPAKTPDGYPCGSLGPTTSGRMDVYLPEFQARGASLVTIGKGNRDKTVVASCKQHGGFYLGTIGGAAALLGHDCVTEIKVLDFAELGMEAVYQINVKDFPAFLLIDDKGNDFFEKTLQ